MRKGKTQYHSTLFQAVLENSAEAIVILEADGSPLEVFPGIEKILGITPEEAMSTAAFSIIHPDDINQVKKGMADCFAKDESCFENIVYRIRHKQGHWVWVNSTLRNCLHHPEINGVINSFRDISKEQKLLKDQGELIRQLRERNEFIESILRNLPIGIAINDITTGEAKIVNDRFTDIYGWDIQDFSDVEGFFNKVYPDPAYRSQISDRILADIASGDPERMSWDNISVTTKLGGHKVINAKNIPLPGQSLMISTVTDVTENHLQRQHIEHILANQDAMINAGDELIWSVDPDFLLIAANRSFAEAIKTNSGKTLKKGDSLLISDFGPKVNEKWRKYYNRALKGDKFSVKEKVFSKSRNREVYDLISFNPIIDIKGEIIGVACYSKDVTDDTLSSLATERSRAELAMIMDASPDIICTINKEGNFVNISAASISIWGYLPVEMTGKPFLDFIYQPDQESTKKVVEQIITGEKLSNFENRYLKKDGTVVPMAWSVRWDVGQQMIYCVAKDASERNNAERELAFKAKLLDTVGQAVVATDLDGKVIFWNKAAESIYGWSEQEAVGENIIDLIPADQSKEDAADIFQALIAGKQWSGEFLVKSKSGSVFPVLVNDTAIYGENNQIIGIIGISSDISESKVTERQLLLNQQQLNVIYQTVADVLYLISVEPDGRFKFISVNKAFLDVTGLTNELVAGKYVDEVIPEDSWKIVALNYQKAIERKQSVKWEETSAYPNGTKTGLVAITPVIDADGNCHRLVGSVLDISENKRAELELKASEEKYRLIFQNSPLPKWIYDLEDFRILDVNLAAERQYGYTREEFLQMTLDDVRPKEEVPKLRTIQETIKNRQGTVKFGIFTHRKKDGSHLMVEISGNPLLFQDMPCMMVVCNDVTDRESALLALKDQQHRLETAQRIAKLGYWQLNLADETLQWSPEVYHIWNIDKNVKPDLHLFFNTLHPDDRDRFMQAQTDVLDAVKEFDIEHRIILQDGTTKWLHAIGKLEVIGNGNVLSGTVQDITRRKLEEERLRLYESMVANTHDSILITEAEPFDEPGPKIVYVNKAFSKMTGYSAEELIGQTPRILQGPKSDREALKRFSESIRKWQPCEIETINYKKNGEEFWINFSATPVADEKGWFTHWVAIERDITRQKTEQFQKALLSDLRGLFGLDLSLENILTRVLEHIVTYGDFSVAEFWLVDVDKQKINLAAQVPPSAILQEAYRSVADQTSYLKGKGLPGKTWESGQVQFWHTDEIHRDYVRLNAAKSAGLKNAYGIPLFYNQEVVGVLEIGLSSTDISESKFSLLIENIGFNLGPEIKRKQLEQELNQIFIHARDIICVAGLDGSIKKINPAACQLLGYTEEELLAKPFAEFIYAVDQDRSKNALQVLAEYKDVYYFENRCITKEGKVVWISWTITPSNEEQLLFCIGKDITDKKELEGLLHRATDMARIGGWEIDVISGSVFWSEMTRIIHEVPDDFLPDLNNTLAFYKDLDSRNAIDAMIKSSIKNGSSWTTEAEIFTAKGRSCWVKIIGEAEFQNNKCVRVYGSFQDIDSKKRLELELEQSLTEKRTILESIGDAFFTLDKKWEVTYWNKMATRLTGVPANLILGKNIWDVFPDYVGSESHRQYHSAIEKNASGHFEDFYAALGIWLEISCYPSIDGLTVYFKDISERKTAEQQMLKLTEDLGRQTKELTISNTELEQFAYVASHDLQEPLRMITSFLSQLDRKYGESLDDKGKQYIHFAVDGAKRMREIILDLLEFSRVGKTEERLDKIDLNELMAEVKGLYRRMTEETKATISWGALPELVSYRGPLRQVFQNLIGNGLKYQKKDQSPVIHISCIEKHDAWEFTVADNGIGIKPDYFEKIFVIFQRLHNKDEFSGTGMGLSITKKIIDNLGGKIWVESEEGKGSKFHFTVKKVKL